MFKSNSGRYYIAGIKRFIPQAKGEWVEDEESEDRFMDGYGMLFEDFRASKREHDAANEIVEREERERRREELIITDWITQQREEEEEEGEDEYEQNNAAARAARKRIRTDNVVVEKKNRQCEDSEDSDAEARAVHSSHQACMFQGFKPPPPVRGETSQRASAGPGALTRLVFRFLDTHRRPSQIVKSTTLCNTCKPRVLERMMRSE